MQHVPPAPRSLCPNVPEESSLSSPCGFSPRRPTGATATPALQGELAKALLYQSKANAGEDVRTAKSARTVFIAIGLLPEAAVDNRQASGRPLFARTSPCSVAKRRAAVVAAPRIDT